MTGSDFTVARKGEVNALNLSVGPPIIHRAALAIEDLVEKIDVLRIDHAIGVRISETVLLRIVLNSAVDDVLNHLDVVSIEIIIPVRIAENGQVDFALVFEIDAFRIVAVVAAVECDCNSSGRNNYNDCAYDQIKLIFHHYDHLDV